MSLGSEGTSKCRSDYELALVAVHLRVTAIRRLARAQGFISLRQCPVLTRDPCLHESDSVGAGVREDVPR